MCEPALPEAFEQIAYLDKEACEALPQHQLALFDLLRWFHELPPLRRAILRIIFPGQGYEDEEERKEEEEEEEEEEEREPRDTFSSHSPVDRVSEDRVDGVDARGALEEGAQEGHGGEGHVGEGNTGDAQGGGKSAEGGESESNGMEQSAAGATFTAHEPPANRARYVELRTKQLEPKGAHNIRDSSDSPASHAGSRLPAARPVPAQPAHYRTRNDFLQHRRRQQEEVQEDVDPARPLSMAMEQVTAAATTAEMTKGAQVAALQIFGAPSAVDVTVEALLAPNVMEGMGRLQFEGCWRLSASVIRRACNRFLNCTYLDVKGAVSMDDATLKHIASVCQQLQLLQIGGASTLNPKP